MPYSPKKKLFKWFLLILSCTVVAVCIAIFSAQQSDRNFDVALEHSSLDQLQRLATNPSHDRDPLVFYWLAVRLGEKGQQHNALNALLRSVQLNPNLAKSRYALGVLLDQTNHPQEAEGQLQQAIKLNSNRPDAYFALGKLYGKYGKFREAELCLRKATALNPDDIEAPFLLSVILLELATRTNEPFREEARDILLKLEKKAPQDTRILSVLASSHVFFSQIQEAEALYRRILKIDPTDLKSKTLLGRSIAEQATEPKGFAEAEQLLLDCAAKDAKNPAIPLALGILYLRQAKPTQAIPYLKSAIDKKTMEPEVWFHLGRAYMQVGKAQEAQKATAIFTQRDQNRREIRSLQLRLGFEQGDTAEQIKQADAIRLQLAQVHLKDSNYPAARKLLEAILSHDPTQKEAQNSLKHCTTLQASSHDPQNSK